MTQNYNPNNTDRNNEYLTEVDENDNVLGKVTRIECHNETKRPWHRSVHVYLFDKNGYLYLSQRSYSKDTAAGKWTVSAGGHVKFGDEPLKTAQREVEEELGVKAKLSFIDKLKVDYGSEKEIISIYAGVTKEIIRINSNEVNQVKLFEYEKIVNEFLANKFDLSGGSRDSFKWVIKSGSLDKFRQSI